MKKFFCSHTKERNIAHKNRRDCSMQLKVPIGERIRPCPHNEEPFVYSEKHPPMLTQRRLFVCSQKIVREASATAYTMKLFFFCSQTKRPNTDKFLQALQNSNRKENPSMLSQRRNFNLIQEVSVYAYITKKLLLPQIQTN